MESVNKIAIYLNRHIVGNVYDKDSILEAFSTDRSMLKIKPRFVAVPESTSDIRKLVKFVDQLSEKKYELPIAVRGSGLSKTGSDLTSGLVISMEKLCHVRELDAHDRLVHVQAGITIGKLNAILAPHGLTLPISAEPNETIGSIISNCPKDKFSKKYGGIMNYVDRVEVVLSNGELIQTSRLSRSKLKQKINQKGREGKVYKKISEYIDSKRPADNQILSKEGYTGIQHVERRSGKVFDLMPIFFGAEGNLGIITEVILRLEPLPPRPHRIFAVFNTIKSAKEFADECTSLKPLSVEIFDTRIFKETEEYGKKPDLLTKKINDGYVVLASFNDKSRKSRQKIRKCIKFLPKSATVVFETISNSKDFDDFETSLKLFLNCDSKEEKPYLLHDLYIPKEKLQEFTQKLKKLEKTTKKELALFGNYSSENFNLSPSFNLEKVDERRTAITLLRDISILISESGGSIVGGYPEGKLKALIIYPELKKKEKKEIETIKDIFDPNNIFSPETKSNYDTRSTIRHLRTDNLEGIIP